MNFKEVPHGNMYNAGLEYARQQGLKPSEYYLFAEALSAEYWCDEMRTTQEDDSFFGAMFDMKVVYVEELKDDFIVGKVNEMHFPYTIISSEETIPHKFYGKEVEIRLKEIVKKPEKFKYEQTSVVRSLGHWSKDSGEYCTNGNIQAELKKCVGKNVKITIEEVE
jgi:hypothetical protein